MQGLCGSLVIFWYHQELLNVTKELSHVILELHNVKMEQSNVRKKIREPPNVTNVLSNMILELHNVRMEPSNMGKKKKKGTTKYDKRIVTCDVGPGQYKDETIKCEDLITWYSRLPISGYRTLKKGVR